MTNLSNNEVSSRTDFKKLRENLVAENNFLTALIDTIPANVYFNHDIQEKITHQKHSLMNAKAKDLKRGFHQVELSAKNKHKRAKLDPLFQKSVTQIQQEMDNKKERKKKAKGLQQPSVSLTRAANIEELQKRLKDRIKEFRTRRKAARSTNPQESKKLLTRLKKLKGKAARNEKKQLMKPQAEPPAKKAKTEKTTDKPVYNKENKIIYSQLAFSEEGNEDKKKSDLTGKNYKKLLHKVEKRKEKIENLKTSNPELATNLEEKEKWKKAILKAENVKIKDDAGLLKKSIKRQEKIKKKKTKEWKERTEHVEHKKKSKQEKRTKNLKQRKKDKLDHKIKIAKKKGRVIPGF